MPAREIPTLALEGTGPFRVTATSYGRTQPSGLGEFNTEAEAVQAMKKLQAHLDEQKGKKEVSRKKVRMMGAD